MYLVGKFCNQIFFKKEDQQYLHRHYYTDLVEETFLGIFMFKKNHAQNCTKSTPEESNKKQCVFSNSPFIVFCEPFIQAKGQKRN